jgi:hypothetical protein
MTLNGSNLNNRGCSETESTEEQKKQQDVSTRMFETKLLYAPQEKPTNFGLKKTESKFE